MTQEMHRQIVQAGMRELLKLPRRDLRKLIPWLKTAHIRWVLDHPEWEDPEYLAACELIKRAAALMRSKPEP